MCCSCSQGQHSGKDICPNLWSKDKKIKMLEQELDVAQDRSKEIKNLIAQLKAEN